jgi:hypothetical protein
VIIKLAFILFYFIVGCTQLAGQNRSLESEDNNLFNLISGDLSMIIDGNTGSRVISLKLGDNEILGTNKLNTRMYGSTLWLSPQGKWRQGILDAGPYSLSFFIDDKLSLQSKPDTLNNFAFLKEFHSSKNDTSFVIKYSITNLSEEIQGTAAWEVTRVPAGGLVLFPKRSEKDIPFALRVPLLPIRDSLGVIWYPYDPSTLSAQKIFMEGGEGWIAYIKNSVIFIKKFPVIPLERIAPNESNVEIYVNKEKTYIELENQGEYLKLMPGESLFYEVKWYARRLPANVKAEVGNEALIRYIRNITN